MLNRSKIMKAAHAQARILLNSKAFGSLKTYAKALSAAMRGAWATAKREAAQAALPKRTPADNLRAEIVSEENRDRGHSFARIAELKAQLSALEGVA